MCTKIGSGIHCPPKLTNHYGKQLLFKKFWHGKLMVCLDFFVNHVGLPLHVKCYQVSLSMQLHVHRPWALECQALTEGASLPCSDSCMGCFLLDNMTSSSLGLWVEVLSCTAI